MKQRVFAWILALMLACAPVLALAEEGEQTPLETPIEQPASEALAIETEHVFQDMERSYGMGYVPTVENDTAILVLPLVGSVKGDRIRVTPQLSTGAPYAMGNYQFDVLKTTEQASDETMHEVFLVRLALPLNTPRTNGTYPIPFLVEYTNAGGEAMQQTFPVQLVITDGKNPSSGGGGYTPSVSKPILLVESVATAPALPCGGESVQLMLSLQNAGNAEAKNVRIMAVPADESIRVDALNALFVPSVPVKQSVSVTLNAAVLPGASGGQHLLTVQLQYEDRTGGSYADESRIALTVTQPKVEIVSIAYPDSIYGGEDIPVQLTLQNTGDRAAENVCVRYASEDASIRLKGVEDTVSVGTMQPGEKKDVSLDLRALPSAFEGRHTLVLSVEYGDAPSGGRYAEPVEYPVTVSQKAVIGYDQVRLPESVTSGESFTLPICVYNTGFTPVYNVRAQLDCDGLICSSAFLGNLDPQASADKTLTVFVTTLSGSQKYGQTYGSVSISYEDADGERYNEFASVQMSITEPQKQTDEEKLREQQKVEEQQLLSQWWVSILVGIAIICILIAVLVIYKFMRMLKMK